MFSSFIAPLHQIPVFTLQKHLLIKSSIHSLNKSLSGTRYQVPLGQRGREPDPAGAHTLLAVQLGREISSHLAISEG
jgi:hypothetical protein